MGTGSTCPRSCTVERERAEGSRSFRANELRKLPYHQGHNRFGNLRSRPHTLREPQTTWCGNRREHAGKFASLAARSTAGEGRGEDAELQIYRRTSHAAC